MAILRDKVCPVCSGHGFVVIQSEYSIGSISCENCFGTGLIKTPITNSERLAELSSPVDQLKFFRGFAKNAVYAGTPLRLLDINDDGDLLEWLNKVSDDLDDYIFENK